MNFLETDKIDSLDTVRTFFDETPEGMFLLDRRGRVHMANAAIEQLTHRSNDKIIETSFGEALGCIHILDHADGCGYGSICGDCFLLKGMKEALRTRKPVESTEGSLALGVGDGGVIRPQLKADITPLRQERRMYLMVSLEQVTS